MAIETAPRNDRNANLEYPYTLAGREELPLNLIKTNPYSGSYAYTVEESD